MAVCKPPIAKRRRRYLRTSHVELGATTRDAPPDYAECARNGTVIDESQTNAGGNGHGGSKSRGSQIIFIGAATPSREYAAAPTAESEVTCRLL